MNDGVSVLVQSCCSSFYFVLFINLLIFLGKLDNLIFPTRVIFTRSDHTIHQNTNSNHAKDVTESFTVGKNVKLSTGSVVTIHTKREYDVTKRIEHECFFNLKKQLFGNLNY